MAICTAGRTANLIPGTQPVLMLPIYKPLLGNIAVALEITVQRNILGNQTVLLIPILVRFLVYSCVSRDRGARSKGYCIPKTVKIILYHIASSYYYDCVMHNHKAGI